MLPKTSTYIKSYNGQTKWVYFLMKNDDLLEKYNIIWCQVSAGINKEFDSKPDYNKTFLKTKIKSHVMKLQIFVKNKCLRCILIILL